MVKKWFVILIVAGFFVFIPGEASAESYDYVDTEFRDFFGCRVAFEISSVINADKMTYVDTTGGDKNWVVDKYKANYDITVKPVYSDRYTDGNWVPDPFYAEAGDLDAISHTFVPQLITEDGGQSYQLYSGDLPYQGILEDTGVEEWEDLFSNTIKQYTQSSSLYSGNRGIILDLLGQDDDDDEPGAVEAFFGETTSFFGPMDRVEAYEQDDAVWFTHLKVTADIDFYTEDDIWKGSDVITFDVPVSVPGPIELNGINRRVIQTFEQTIYFPIPKGLNLSQPYYTDVNVVGTEVTGWDEHKTVRAEPIGIFETAVRTTDLVVKNYIAPYTLWGYILPASEYHNDAPVPTGRQYPNGGQPDPNIAIFGSIVESTGIKLLYKCQPGGGDNSGPSIIPGFEACAALLAALTITIWYKRGEKK